MKRFSALYFTNFWGVLNDNFLKTLACFVAVRWVAEEYQSLVISLAAGALVLPYILLSPLADRMTAKYRKRDIVRIFKWSELLIVAVGISGFCLQNVWVVILSIVLMGTQSSLYSPAKYGLIRDIGGVGNVSTGMGGMEAVAFLGMLAGTVSASFLADEPIVYSYLLLALFALLGLAGSYTLRADERLSDIDYSVNPLKFYHDGKSACDGGLMPVVRTLSIFWWMAATLQMGLILYCPRYLGMDSLHTGVTLSIAAIGITVGCVVAGYVDRRHSIIHLVPLFGILLTIESLFLFFIKWKTFSSSLLPFSIFIFAFTSGFFKIPLDAEIQKKVEGTKLNLVLAFFNQVSFIYILIASATFALMCMVLPVRYMFLLIAVVMALTSVYIFLSNRTVLTSLLYGFIKLHYSVDVKGGECMKEGTLLVLPTHKAVSDPFIVLGAFSEYNLQPLVDEGYYSVGIFRRVLSLFNAVKVPDVRKNRSGVSVAQRLNSLVLGSLESGGSVLFYPSGHITTDGSERLEGRKLAFTVCSQLPDNVRVIGVRIDGLWGSRTSRYGRTTTPNLFLTFLKYFYKFFGPKRKVTLTVSDITADVRVWAAANDKKEFNNHLENYYNGDSVMR